MFQRIQTIFLLLAIVATAITFFLPIAIFELGNKAVAIYTNYGLMSVDDKGLPKLMTTGYNFVIAAAILALIAFTISQFKRRKLQILVCRITYVLLMFQAGFSYASLHNATDSIKLAGDKITQSFGFSFYMPIAAILFVLLAERFIKRDEDLVKSADRLR